MGQGSKKHHKDDEETKGRQDSPKKGANGLAPVGTKRESKRGAANEVVTKKEATRSSSRGPVRAVKPEVKTKGERERRGKKKRSEDRRRRRTVQEQVKEQRRRIWTKMSQAEAQKRMGEGGDWWINEEGQIGKGDKERVICGKK